VPSAAPFLLVNLSRQFSISARSDPARVAHHTPQPVSASTPTGAVFLSYAHEDADATLRICKELRGAGVQVWFDQSELRGGDAWDAKIRKQIKECALFIPVISANTQARKEGYFRLEWKLAAQRTYLIADGSPFLLPIVIDATTESVALVPEEFRHVQWVPVSTESAIQSLVARTKTLLASANGDLMPAPVRQARPPKSGRRLVWGVAIGAGITIAAAWVLPRLGEKKTAPETIAAAPETPKPDETSRLLAQARELIYDPDAARSEFALAESLLKRAIDLAPDSATAWGLSALLHVELNVRGFDRSQDRLARSKADADKALRLSNDNVDAAVALGMYQRLLGNRDAAKAIIERARAAHPKDWKVYVESARLLPTAGERIEFYKASLDLVTDNRVLLYNASNIARDLRRWTEAEALSDRLLAATPFWRGYEARAITEYLITADPEKIYHWLNQVPVEKRDQPRGVILRFKTELLRRNGGAAEAAIRVIPSDYIEDSTFNGPRAFLIAQAREVSGRGSAVEQWRVAADVLAEKIRKSPDSSNLRLMLAIALAGQDKLAEAYEVISRYRNGEFFTTSVDMAHTCARLGDADAAITLLRRSIATGRGILTHATLRAEPRWDPIRNHPEYAELVHQLAAADGVLAR
jgi:tetratricopeptide (TPR) repeat protein